MTLLHHKKILFEMYYLIQVFWHTIIYTFKQAVKWYTNISWKYYVIKSARIPTMASLEYIHKCVYLRSVLQALSFSLRNETINSSKITISHDKIKCKLHQTVKINIWSYVTNNGCSMLLSTINRGLGGSVS